MPVAKSSPASCRSRFGLYAKVGGDPTGQYLPHRLANSNIGLVSTFSSVADCGHGAVQTEDGQVPRRLVRRIPRRLPSRGPSTGDGQGLEVPFNSLPRQLVVWRKMGPRPPMAIVFGLKPLQYMAWSIPSAQTMCPTRGRAARLLRCGGSLSQPAVPATPTLACLNLLIC